MISPDQLATEVEDEQETLGCNHGAEYHCSDCRRCYVCYHESFYSPRRIPYGALQSWNDWYWRCPDGKAKRAHEDEA